MGWWTLLFLLSHPLFYLSKIISFQPQTLLFILNYFLSTIHSFIYLKSFLLSHKLFYLSSLPCPLLFILNHSSQLLNLLCILNHFFSDTNTFICITFFLNHVLFYLSKIISSLPHTLLFILSWFLSAMASFISRSAALHVRKASVCLSVGGG